MHWRRRSVSFSLYWNRLVRSNSSLKDTEAKMTMSVKSFQVQLLKAYREGQEDQERREDRSSGDWGDMFGQFFK